MLEELFYTPKQLRKLYDSDFYRVANDMLKRCWYRCFSGNEHFEEYLQKEGLTGEYSKYMEQSDRILEMLDSTAAKAGLTPIRQNYTKPKR